MILARLQSDGGGRTLVMVGLNRQNIERLTDGKPLHLEAKEADRLGIGAEILIAFGERYEDLVHQLAHAGIDIPSEMLDAARGANQ